MSFFFLFLFLLTPPAKVMPMFENKMREDVLRAGSGEPARQERNATNTLEEEIEKLLHRAEMLREFAALPLMTEEQKKHAQIMKALADAYERRAYELAAEIEDEDWEDLR